MEGIHINLVLAISFYGKLESIYPFSFIYIFRGGASLETPGSVCVWSVRLWELAYKDDICTTRVLRLFCTHSCIFI